MLEFPRNQDVGRLLLIRPVAFNGWEELRKDHQMNGEARDARQFAQ